MLFKKHEDHPNPPPQALYGTFGVWHTDRNANPFEKRHHRDPNPQQMWFYMMPMMHETWHHSEHKSHRGCHGRKHWKHGPGHHEINPEKFNEMILKMKEMQTKENSTNGASFRHKHGFCRRHFSDINKNEQKQNPTSEYFFEKQSLHSNIY